MNHGYLDRYARGSSVLHRLPAIVKLPAAVLLVVVTAFAGTGHAWLLLVETILLIAAVVVSRVPKIFLLRRILLFEPLMLGTALVGLVGPGGWPVFGLLLSRSNLAVTTMVLFANVTPFTEVLDILRRLRLPAVFVTIMSLMYRYLFVVIDQSERMSRARRSRTFTTKSARSWQTWSAVLGMLFVRSTERAERIYAAMIARGWQ
jgi:cobalt/nickel transport system permease protein